MARVPTNSAARQNQYKWMGPVGFSIPEIRLKMVFLLGLLFISLTPLLIALIDVFFSLTAPPQIAWVGAIVLGTPAGFAVAAALTKIISARIDVDRPTRFVFSQLLGELQAPRATKSRSAEYVTSTYLPKAIQDTRHVTDTTYLWERSDT